MDWVGGALIVIVLVVVGPTALFFGGAVWSAVMGFFATGDAEARYEGSEEVKYRSW